MNHFTLSLSLSLSLSLPLDPPLGTTPHPPSNVSVTTSTFSATISWEPSYDGGYEQTYIIWYRMADLNSGGGEWKTIRVHPEGATAFTLYNLQQDTEYEFLIYARNLLGEGLPTNVVRMRTKPWSYSENETILPTDGYGSTYIPPVPPTMGPKPGIPQNITVQRVALGHAISWLPPISGEVPVAYYRIDYQEDKGGEVFHWGPFHKETTFLAKNLKPGHTYLIRVIAYSVLGAGSPSPVYEFDVAGIGSKNSKDKAIAAGIVGGILFFIAAIVLSVCAVKLCNKSRRRKHEKAYMMVTSPFIDPVSVIGQGG